MNSSTVTVRESGRFIGVYLLLLVGTVFSFLMIREFGRSLAAPAAATTVISTGTGSKAEINVVFHVLITLTAIIAVGNLLAWIMRRLGQPAVIGEIVAGILLGPSVLGAIAPDAMHFLIPSSSVDPHGLVIASLKAISQLGIVLYMFIVGLELNTRKVGHNAKAAVAISHASIVAPFISGAGLALWLYPVLSTNEVPFTSFALFLGVAMSITAFPVLARIITDQRLEHTDLGTIALSCAASDDVTAWCLLAFVVGITKAQIGNAILVAVWTVVFVAVMFLIIRPLVTKWVAWAESRQIDRGVMPVLLVAVLCSALITESIGIHAVFGAFLLGAVIPHDSRMASELRHKLYDVVTILFLPAFFAITGMNTRIGLIAGWDSWLICGVIILVATIGKFGGTIAASRFVGLNWRTSSALGILMNTRGLMELIVLNIGLSLGVISPKLFAMMVIMALVTTIATAPILRSLVRKSHAEGEGLLMG